MRNILLVLTSLYLAVLGYLYLTQRSFIYFPDYTRPVSIPTNFELKHDGLLLKGWVLNKDAGDAVIYFGGNGEAVEKNLPLFYNIFKTKAVYLVSYRGYGDSEGEPTESGIYSDALALYDKIKGKYASISIVGRSLGSAVATYVSANRVTKKLVLITPFDSLENLAQMRFPIVPVGYLLNDKYLSITRARQIKADTLVIYGGNDQVVPESSTKRLIAGFLSGRVEVKMIRDAGHNSISDFAEFKRVLAGFFNKQQANID